MFKNSYKSTTSSKTTSCTDNTSPTSVTSHGLFVLNEGDEIEVYVANNDGTANIEVSIANITVVGTPA